MMAYATWPLHFWRFDAMDERDFASRVFLDWFVQEQVEEEKTSGLLAEQLRMVGEDRPGLLMLDRELGQSRRGAAEAPAAET